MPHRDDIIRMRHMLDASTEAAGYADSKVRADLDTDRTLVHSLVRCLEITGEAAAKVSKDCRSQYDSIPWDDIIGMRNRLIHAYFDINLNIVWRTVKEELPALIKNLELALSEYEFD